MSIPPLVCSTPPPPDQCEDDRDTEDFDIHYNLSQDDEDDGNDYNYGTYSDYIYSSSTSTNMQDKWSADITKKAECTLPNDLVKENVDNITVLPENYGSTVDKVGFEDTAIEDLNLKIENENDLASSASKGNTETSEVISSGNGGTETSEDFPEEISGKESDTSMHVAPAIDKIEGVSTVVTHDLKRCIDADNDTKMFEEGIKSFQEEILNEDALQEIYDIDKGIDDDDVCLNDATIVTDGYETNEVQQDVPVVSNLIDQINKSIIDTEQKDPNVIEHKGVVDDFGDFDDFQFISSETNPGMATIEFCDNTWDKDKEVYEDSEFGDFTANFDTEEPNPHLRTDDSDKNKGENKKEEFSLANTDDFGDFDDFKSSSNDHTEDIILNQFNQNEPSQSVNVLSVQNSPESEVQIIESISSVLSSIFLSEITEHDSPFESTLESSLNETWGHLVDTDVRQPYIVNWNNSLGQKSLLKALCIDSRNILFGPKWNSGMPKYAANLTVAPLQPQKPITPNVNLDDQNIDKNISKEAGSWTDPFTSDGQESCNSEGGSAAPARPTNLDVFSKVSTPNIDKIYSSTLSVQPIRQINLPDTHIFTPTDSETPRSKTIHYDHGSTVLVPQPPEENHQAVEALSESQNEVPVNNSENDEDYWEFQDFKGSVKNSDVEIPSVKRLNEGDINNSTLPIATNYQTQILQPIKVEPMIPTLNWPAPGEVKDTFDDFSEFVSNTQWTDNINITKQTDSEVNCKNNDEVVIKNDTIIDDFETFQSAPSFKQSVTDSTLPTTGNVINHNFDDFGQFSDTKEPIHTIHSKTDPVAIVTQKDNFAPLKPRNNSPTVKHNNVKTSPILSLGSHSSNTVLQPSIASMSSKQRNQQKTGQILQPLTLESYSQINWPNPGIDLQDLSRFNPVESLQSLKTEVSSGGSKVASPAHKDTNSTRLNEISDEDIWGDFVSSKPKQQQQQQTKKISVFADDDEWTDFVSSPSVKPPNGLSTISLNVHTNLNIQKASAQGKFSTKTNQILDIPPLNYVTPKASNRGMYNDKHFQNL